MGETPLHKKEHTMLAETCQIATRYPNISCTQKSAGFLLRTDDSPTAVYLEGFVVCKGHGFAMEGPERHGNYVTIGKLADLMNDEERKANANAHAEETDMTATATAPVTTSNPARIDLGQLAAMVNSRSVESRPVVEPKVIAVPRASEEPAPNVQDLGRVKSEEELEEEAIQRQIAALKAKADAIKRARLERAKAEAEAARAAKALEQNAAYQFTQAAQLRAYLMLHGGSSTMQAVETLLDAGVLTVKSGALVVRNGAGTVRAPRESTAGSQPSTPVTREANTERNAAIIRLHREGKTQGQIITALGLPPETGIVAGVVHRYKMSQGA
jgi:hypothetical protein